MESRIVPSFKKVKSKCYSEHKEEFYVFCETQLCAPKTVIKYIGNRHEDEKYIEETIPAMEFSQRLIRHIPEKHFKMIQYGGLYARHRKINPKHHHAIPKSKHHIYHSFNQWRTVILSSFGYAPLECPDCQHKMLFLELYYNHKRVSLEELYEKAMSKSRGKHSSA